MSAQSDALLQAGLPVARRVVDGFFLSSYRRMSQLNYYTHVMHQLELLRRSDTYRQKIHTVSPAVIPAYETTLTQLYIKPWSWLTALSFSGQTPGVPFVLPPFRITDGGTGIPLASDLQFGFTTAFFLTASSTPQMFLSEPRLISAPGLVNVEISNNTAVDIPGIQLCLWIAEPCLSIEQQDSECQV